LSTSASCDTGLKAGNGMGKGWKLSNSWLVLPNTLAANPLSQGKHRELALALTMDEDTKFAIQNLLHPYDDPSYS
jgi:hypothetical protein